MYPIEGLYSLEELERSEGCGVYSVRLNGAHSIYTVHFPQSPILPGVCMLYMVRECTARLLERNVEWEELRSCKFVRLVDPRKITELQVVVMPKEGCRIEGRVEANGEVVAKIQARYRE